MRIDILTLFPDMIKSVLEESITGRALKNNVYELNVHNIRDFTDDKHRRVDDYPYGGGSGMVMEAEPIYNAYKHIENEIEKTPKVIFLTPHGKVFNQEIAHKLKYEENLVFLCGHYEGVDQRIIDKIVWEEISLGDFVLTGGELAVLPICDSIIRLLPGAVGNDMSTIDESFENSLLEYPQYTRPESFLGMEVPKVLMSGHHKNIEKWRREKSLELTLKKRPDLLEKAQLSKEDKIIIEEMKKI